MTDPDISWSYPARRQPASIPVSPVVSIPRHWWSRSREERLYRVPVSRSGRVIEIVRIRASSAAEAGTWALRYVKSNLYWMDASEEGPGSP
jgi:hypothetical protein